MKSLQEKSKQFIKRKRIGEKKYGFYKYERKNGKND